MKITINDIKVRIHDVSTPNHNQFLIDYFEITYDVLIFESHFSGTIKYSSETNLAMNLVVEYIERLYSPMIPILEQSYKNKL